MHFLDQLFYVIETDYNYAVLYETCNVRKGLHEISFEKVIILSRGPSLNREKEEEVCLFILYV